MNRLFVEKKSEFNAEARSLLRDLQNSLGLGALTSLRIIQRYDIDGLDDDEFAAASRLILAEPQVDRISEKLDLRNGEAAFAVEYLPGQFDQRADSASQCVQILTQGPRPRIASAKVIAIDGELHNGDLERVKEFVINKVDSREASMQLPESLEVSAGQPPDVQVLLGFTTDAPGSLDALRREMGLAMSPEDLRFCQEYFRDTEHRDPTITEIRMLD
ncbi:MAG: phosphoribosylformylglycinamidine synthase, partial [Akkermansiaceae bacterium]|nr:phosphoribosylformylglycinamidine synthase [Akkermansiaceae bacterium]